MPGSRCVWVVNLSEKIGLQHAAMTLTELELCARAGQDGTGFACEQAEDFCHVASRKCREKNLHLVEFPVMVLLNSGSNDLGDRFWKTERDQYVRRAEHFTALASKSTHLASCPLVTCRVAREIRRFRTPGDLSAKGVTSRRGDDKEV